MVFVRVRSSSHLMEPLDGCGRGRGLLIIKLGEAARKRWMGRECGGIGPAVRSTIGATASHSDGGRHEGKRRGRTSESYSEFVSEF